MPFVRGAKFGTFPRWAVLAPCVRLITPLLSLAGASGGTKVTLSQEELAQFLGLSRQIVNQHLQAWRAEGWIALGRGSVTIANPRALKNVTHQP